MIRLFSGFLAGLCIFLAHLAPASAEDFAQGLFWQVKPPKGPSSILVGSIHIGDKKIRPHIERALGLLPKAQRLVLEMDAQELQKVGQLLHTGEDEPFYRLLPADIAEKARHVLSERGVTAKAQDTMPLWAAILILSSPPRMEPGMDVQLMGAAKDLKRPVYGLETAKEQLDSIRKLPLDVQKGMLVWQINNLSKLDADLQKLVDIYQAEDLARLHDLEFETSAPDTLSAEQQALVFDQLINQRNARMLERMQSHLKAGRALIAVGALHLPGVLQELSALGYTVERLEK